MANESIERLLERLAGAPSINEIEEALACGDNNIVVSNLRGGSPAALLALLARRAARPILLITSNLERAEALTDGAAFFGARPLILPALETLPFETVEPALHIAAARGVALDALARAHESQAPHPLVIAPIDALMPRLLPREALLDLRLRIDWGERVDFDSLARRMTAMGYAREAMVEAPGEFAIRGSIFDVYPAEAERPLRLDFFGDELESIRTFDPATQRSLPLKEEIERIEFLARANLAPALDALAAGRPLINFFDLLPENALIVRDGPSRIGVRLEYFAGIVVKHWEEIHHAPPDEEAPNFFLTHKVKPADWIAPADEARRAIDRFRRVDLIDLSLEEEEADPRALRVAVGAQSFDSLPPDFREYLELIREKQLDRYQIVVVCDNNGQVARLDELLAEQRVSAVRLDGAGEPKSDASRLRPIPPAHHDVLLAVGDLHEGFILPAARAIVLTDREIFGRYKRRRIHRKAHHGKVVSSPSEIQRGDYVVHLEHGIGRFEGIRRQQLDGRAFELIELLYQDDDRLLVPIDKLHHVQKYSGADGKEPTLDKLGQKKWGRRRKKTEEAVKKLAGELLELYARREAAERPPFGPDTVWQQEFEASFVYQETPDQIKAIREVKADLTGPRPSDRLICGDVGYGKTEVAIRAAFKALVEKRQVAVLAPTTILAQQHFTTFKERLAGFPFRVEVLSRFRSDAEQKESLARLASGESHLVIGTHRLLSRDVRFADLGLLIVDEEQRFGVKQKERIKSMRATVDVITLTATPIPRTLHMALSSLRDLSVIQTPPADRLPIKTRTIRFERDCIEEAILRELNRGGQVYFVHNRIATIDEVVKSLREIVPRARIVSAHGQMDERLLERIMIDFIDGKHDILVSTTIIENGIDIPNVNTIVINRADAMGLAQLYQLRGRVGRDVRQAYAYLVIPKGQPITDTAMRRIAALEEFSELGMGFAVAMRDMEIRGTGNILGAEQSGAIADVGFDLYCRLLEEAVRDLRGEVQTESLWPIDVRWPVDQYLPEAYVPVESQRIRFYKDLAAARTLDELEMIREELLDRYGGLPPEGVNLLNAFQVKLALAPWHVDAVRADLPAPDDPRRDSEPGVIRLVKCERPRELAEALDAARQPRDGIDRIAYRADGSVRLYPTDADRSPEALLADFARLASTLPAPDRIPVGAMSRG